MKKIFTFIILSLIFSSTLPAKEINVLGVELLDNVSNYANIRDGIKCKKNNCSYFFKKKSLNLTPDYFTNYYLRTNKDFKVISILGFRLKNENLFEPDRFINTCKQDKSFMIDYFSEKFNLKKNKFIDVYEQRDSILNGSLSLWHHSKINLKPQNNILSIFCNYSKDNKNRWIISVLGVTLMTQKYHRSILKLYDVKKIDEFGTNQIKSYFYPSSY